jgi:hypothetical protein
MMRVLEDDGITADNRKAELAGRPAVEMAT